VDGPVPRFGDTLAYSDFLDDRMTLYAIPTYATLAAGHGGPARIPGRPPGEV